MACVPPCPTGAIDNWRTVLKADAYSIDEQYTWDVLPEQGTMAAASPAPDDTREAASATNDSTAEADGIEVDTVRGSVVPPWSAARPYVNLYMHKNPTTATVVGNYRLTDESTESDIHHIVLDFGSMPFPVLEGQSIGILPPGSAADGRAYHARQYSIASPRDGERPGYNNVSLTVKRVNEDYQGNAANGVCSNYLCDLKKGDVVNV